MIRLLLVFLLLATDALAEVKLGAIASLQGSASEQGKNWLEGVQLAVDEMNAAGVPVKLIVEDDSTQPGRAATAFNKLSKADHVQGVIGGTWDFLAQVLYPLAARDRLPLITPSNPQEQVRDAAKTNPYVFTNGLSVGAEEKVIEAFLRARHPKTIGVVTVQNAWALLHSEMVKQTAQRLGIAIISEIEISLEEQQTVYKSAAQRMWKKRPEAIYVLADYSGLDLFMAELQNLRWSPLVLEAQHLEGAYRFSNNNDKRYENIYGVHPKFKDGGFSARFQAKFKHKPGVFAVEGYDAAQFLVRAIDAKVPFGDRTATFSMIGLKGEMHLPAPDGNLLDDHAVIVHYQNGKGTELPDGQ